VRHQDAGGARLRLIQPQVLHQQAQPARRELVQRTERFVEQQDVGPDRESARDGDALLLAARQELRVTRGMFLQLHLRQELPRDHLRIAGGPPVALEHEGNVLFDREPVDQARLLEDDAEIDVVASLLEGDVAARGKVEDRHEVQQRRLAAARCADQRDQFAGLHGHAQTVEHGLVAVVHLVDVHALGGTANVQCLGNGNEVAEVAQLNHYRFAA
jgi:hypothetical protein